MSYRKNLGMKLGVVGILLGAYSGFIIRDEYYFSSHQRIDELISEYNIKEKELDSDINILNEQLKELDIIERNKQNIEKSKNKSSKSI